MKQWTLFLFLTAAILLAACGGSSEPIESTRVVSESETASRGEEFVAVAVTRVADTGQNGAEIAPGESPASFSAGDPVTFVQNQSRLIIKNGEINLTVENSGQVINKITDLALVTGGYIINQRLWDQDGFTYASLQMAVPVGEFERSVIAIRGMGQVTRDIASGQDVTEEFVDLDARLGNLEINQERLRTFLSEATNMDDIIKLNNELIRVEGEISGIKGRMNYLKNRAAFSTITVLLDPLIPTPTPTPLPAVASWQPGATASLAAHKLQTQMQSAADFSLYYGIVCGPWLFMLGLIGFVALRLYLRRQNRPAERLAAAPIRAQERRSNE